MKVAFPALVGREQLTQVEKALAGCKALRLSRAQILADFPPECFSAECFPELVAELKARGAGINGTFNGSSARMEDGKLIVTLSHGGVELIRARKIDLLITKLIREQFGLQVSCLLYTSGSRSYLQFCGRDGGA